MKLSLVALSSVLLKTGKKKKKKIKEKKRKKMTRKMEVTYKIIKILHKARDTRKKLKRGKKKNQKYKKSLIT